MTAGLDATFCAEAGDSWASISTVSLMLTWRACKPHPKIYNTKSTRSLDLGWETSTWGPTASGGPWLWGRILSPPCRRPKRCLWYARMGGGCQKDTLKIWKYHRWSLSFTTWFGSQGGPKFHMREPMARECISNFWYLESVFKNWCLEKH